MRVGSSPLARGTQVNGISQLTKIRLIPARSGNTIIIITPDSVTTAHPRSRGEHNKRLIPPLNNGGSSPLARGTPSTISGTLLSTRLIPARAGNT